jgi:fermentation-respiration switch protein FrsA (DUF1100 family)
MTLKTIIFPLLVYFLLLTLLTACQRSLLYHPPRAPLATDQLLAAGYITLDQDLGIWFAAPHNNHRLVVAFFHGNSGEIVGAAAKIDALRAEGFGVLLTEYPGFAGIVGKPTEQTLVEAARVSIDQLTARGTNRRDIVLWGESLGSGVVTQLAQRERFAGVVLEAPFTSVADRAQEIYWWMPARWLVWDRFDVIGRIASIAAPLLIVHGERDQTTPSHHGRALLAAAKEPKRGVFYPAAGHVDLADFGLIAEARRFLQDIEAGRLVVAP